VRDGIARLQAAQQCGHEPRRPQARGHAGDRAQPTTGGLTDLWDYPNRELAISVMSVWEGRGTPSGGDRPPKSVPIVGRSQGTLLRTSRSELHAHSHWLRRVHYPGSIWEDRRSLRGGCAGAEVLSSGAEAGICRFFPSHHTELTCRMKFASRGHDVELDAMLHPRDRRPKRAFVQITAVVDRGLTELRWLIGLAPREGPQVRVAQCATQRVS
jgi:hypothetical protein